MDYHGGAGNTYSNFIKSTVPKTRKRDNSICWNLSCFLCELWAHFPTFHPMGPFRCCWDIFILLAVIYTIIEMPYTLTFGVNDSIIFVSLVIDCIMAIDVFLNFHTAYFSKFDHLRLTTDKRSICKKYLRRRFIFDFIATIPSGLLWHVNVNFWYLKVFRLFRILKILRMIRMMHIYSFLRQVAVYREVAIFLKIGKIIALMVLLSHYSACIWWTIGERTHPSWIDDQDLRDDAMPNFEKYSYAMYWSVVTLFTTGYGDIHATNMAEQWYCCLLIIIGTCFFSYFIGALAVIITEGDRANSFYDEKLEEAREFCEKKRLPKELRRAILTHIRYHCNYNYVFDENDLMNLLPPYLKYDVNLNIAEQFLSQLKIFNNAEFKLEPFIIGAIALKMRSISCNQGYTLYHIGDAANEFYIQRTGVSSLIDGSNHKKWLHRGDVCGEYESFLHRKRQYKVVCNTWSEFYVVNINDIMQILNDYFTPIQVQTKWSKMQKYVQNALVKKVKHCIKLGNNRYCDQHQHDNEEYHKEFVHLFSKNNTPATQTLTDEHEFELKKKKARPRTQSEARNVLLSSSASMLFSFKKNHSYDDNQRHAKIQRERNVLSDSEHNDVCNELNYNLMAGFTEQQTSTTNVVHRKRRFGGKFKVEKKHKRSASRNISYHTDFMDNLSSDENAEEEDLHYID